MWICQTGISLIMNISLLALSGLTVILYAFTAVQTMFQFQNRLWKEYDVQSASENPCEQSIEDWIGSDQKCLPPLGDYRHNQHLPEALCYLANDHTITEGVMKCPGH
jgi:hypothetical protein